MPLFSVDTTLTNVSLRSSSHSLRASPLKDFYPVMVEGLIGYGTGTFKGEALKECLEDLKDTFVKVVSTEKSGMADMRNDAPDNPEIHSKAQ